MALATGRGRGWEPRPRLASLGCAGLWKPVWQRPEPFEAFCGCWLLLPPSLFQRLLSEPRQEASGTPPNPAGLGNRGALEGTLGGQSCGRGSWAGAGVSGSPPA